MSIYPAARPVHRDGSLPSGHAAALVGIEDSKSEAGSSYTGRIGNIIDGRGFRIAA